MAPKRKRGTRPPCGETGCAETGHVPPTLPATTETVQTERGRPKKRKTSRQRASQEDMPATRHEQVFPSMGIGQWVQAPCAVNNGFIPPPPLQLRPSGHTAPSATQTSNDVFNVSVHDFNWGTPATYTFSGTETNQIPHTTTTSTATGRQHGPPDIVPTPQLPSQPLAVVEGANSTFQSNYQAPQPQYHQPPAPILPLVPDFDNPNMLQGHGDLRAQGPIILNDNVAAAAAAQALAPPQGPPAYQVPAAPALFIGPPPDPAARQPRYPPQPYSSDSEDSNSDQEDPFMQPNFAVQQHANDLLGGNAVPFQQPISAPIPSQVPKTLRKKIWRNKHIDLAQLLPSDPLAGPHRGGFRFEVDQGGRFAVVPNQRPRSISSIDAWTSAFLRFVAIYAMRFPFETPALIKYMEIVRDLARKRPGPAFIMYDAQFRHLRESVQIPWDRIHMESWFMATLQPFPGLEQQSFRASRPRSTTRKSKAGRGSTPRYHLNTCWPFNRGVGCNGPTCTHPHVCGYCRGPHSAQACKFTSKQSSSTSPTTNPRSQSNSQPAQKSLRK